MSEKTCNNHFHIKAAFPYVRKHIPQYNFAQCTRWGVAPFTLKRKHVLKAQTFLRLHTDDVAEFWHLLCVTIDTLTIFSTWAICSLPRPKQCCHFSPFNYQIIVVASLYVSSTICEPKQCVDAATDLWRAFLKLTFMQYAAIPDWASHTPITLYHSVPLYI